MLTFAEFYQALNEDTNKDCNFIKDPKLREQCKKLMRRSKGGVRMYGSLGSGATTAGGPAGGPAGGAGGGTGA